MGIYDMKVKKVDGTEVSLEYYKGKVMLIVNTATGCGFTPQYEGLEALYRKYNDKGFEILDFPSNQFLEQAPGTNDEILNFCQTKYGTTFQTFAKVDVNGENAIPLYKYLKKEAPVDIDNGQLEGFRKKLEGRFVFEQDEVQWNFTKFLIDKDGNVVARFAPMITPEEIEAKILELL